MQAGTQAAHRFNRQIRWVTHGQQLTLFVTFDPFDRFDAIARLLPFRQRNAGIDADTVLFEDLRAFDTAVEQGAQQHTDDGEHQAENNAAENDQRFLRFQHARLGDSGVNDSHVTDGTGFGDFQLLLFIQQLHVHLLARLHIARQTHNFLLSFRHRGDAVVEFRFLIFQRLAFFQQRAVSRVAFGVKLGDFRFFEGQLV
ncbi:hypothetical protein D3C72_1144110 [compost metagenome]